VDPLVQQAADSALMAALRIQLAVRRSTDITECQEYRKLQEHAGTAFSLAQKDAARKLAKHEAASKNHQSEGDESDDDDDDDDLSGSATMKAEAAFFALKLRMSIHCGWAIEGALGSNQKVTPSYMGPHLEVLDLLQQLGAGTYRCSVLTSGELAALLSEDAASYTRQIDVLQRSLSSSSASTSLSSSDAVELGLQRLLPPLEVHAVDLWDWSMASASAAATAAEASSSLSSPAITPKTMNLQPSFALGSPVGASSGSSSTAAADNNASRIFAALVQAGSSIRPASLGAGSGISSNNNGSSGLSPFGTAGGVLRVRAPSGSSPSTPRSGSGSATVPSATGVPFASPAAGPSSAGSTSSTVAMLSFASLASTGIVDADLFNRDRSVIPERSRRISVLGGEDIIEHKTQLVMYNPSTFKTDAALLSLRLPYPPAWRSVTRQAVRCYSEGKWKESAALFEKSAKLLGAGKGPSLSLTPEDISSFLAARDPASAVLFDSMWSQGFNAPNGWRGGGYRYIH
jgi:hypothetical protein